jgi:hydroxyacylglutathione hydrolase
MIDPSGLMAATVAIYGEAATRKTYGDVLPAPAARVIETPEGATLRWLGRAFLFLDTPGHARHHCVIHDSASGHVFAGDTFGLSYRELDAAGKQFSFPTTSPSQFDPCALHRSIERIVALGPEAIYVAHFGQVREVARLAADLHRLIDAHAELGRRHAARGAARLQRLKDGVAEIALAERARQGWHLSAQELLALLALDIELNALGLVAWLDAEGG